ncbi:XPA-binding protein 1 [Mycena olivaceomarginata]|nr:XPA-binding protein 1 [Mycena olivaceomarginata]
MSTPSGPSGSTGAGPSKPKPIAIITIGMAGAGKSTFYNLGPNGGILTALNLFTTKFDQVLGLVEKTRGHYVILDTPGQIEIFTWSASVASSLPAVVAYIIDTPRTTAPATSCEFTTTTDLFAWFDFRPSILYKTKLPFILVFNKTDVEPHDFALEWMQDFEAFQAALASHSGTRDSEGEPTYMNSLMNSMSLVLDEFYKHLKADGGVSSMNRRWDQRGLPPELERARKEREKSLQDVKEDSMNRLMKDVAIDREQNPEAMEGDIDIIDQSDEAWPGQYIDVLGRGGHPDESINWPRPG